MIFFRFNFSTTTSLKIIPKIANFQNFYNKAFLSYLFLSNPGCDQIDFDLKKTQTTCVFCYYPRLFRLTHGILAIKIRPMNNSSRKNFEKFPEKIEKFPRNRTIQKFPEFYKCYSLGTLGIVSYSFCQTVSGFYQP